MSRCANCGFVNGPAEILQWGGYLLDEGGGRIYSDACPDGVYLTPKRVEFLGALLRTRGRTVSKDSLYGVIYAHRPESDQPELKIVDVIVCKLRRDISWLRIETVWGRGYKMMELAA